MIERNLDTLGNFYVVGINYKKSDSAIRGMFSINEDQYRKILIKSKEQNVKGLIILSTCNRTEIYGFAESSEILIDLLCSESCGSKSVFTSICYIKNYKKAIQHFYEVAAGLDSQILGDYEIVGQIRMAAKFSKLNNGMCSNLERLANEVLASSKKIRTNTCMSGGTVSVSFAAVQYIKEADQQKLMKNILLIGTGKFGCNTCKNLVDYLPGYKIKLVNRTEEKARLLAESHNLAFEPIERLQDCINEADIIIVATNAQTPLITKTNLPAGKPQILIDLSVPANIHLNVKELENINHVGIDELSRIKDENLQKRFSEIPKAKNIIKEHFDAFVEWSEMRKNVPVLKSVRNTILNLQTVARFSPVPEDRIQRVISDMAIKLKNDNRKGCNYIEAINDYIAISANRN